MKQTLFIGSVILTVALLSSSFYLFDLGTTSQNHLSDMFDSWKGRHGKTYTTQFEHDYRFSVFSANLLEVQRHNGNVSKRYTKGLNQFSDLTGNEFIALYSNPIISQRASQLIPEIAQSQASSPTLSSSEINWVKLGYVTSVKDEGQCGACYALSALGSLEAVNKMSSHNLVSLSTQQIIDCSSEYGNQGCNGGYMISTYKFIKDKGITTEQAYPYEGAKQTCKIKGGNVTLKSYTEISNCNDLTNALMSRPIAIGIDGFQYYKYKGGVFECTEIPNVGHAATVVGMTSEYWLVKEVYGTDWGQSGYIRIAKEGNACGLCTMGSYPVM